MNEEHVQSCLQPTSVSDACLQIEGLSPLGRLQELTIRHNPILRQVLLRPYISFCLPKLQVSTSKPCSVDLSMMDHTVAYTVTPEVLRD